MKHFFGIHAVKSLLTNQSALVCNLFVQRSRSDKKISELIALAQQNNIKVTYVEHDYLNKLTDKQAHQGIVALVSEYKIYDENDVIPLLTRIKTVPLFLILDGVQDPHNLGACMRSANAAGVDAVIIPKDRAVAITPVVSKVACGAAELTPLIQVTNLGRAITTLQANGIWIYGATAEATETIYEHDLKGPMAIVLGGEERGLRLHTRTKCDYMMKIPMLGAVSSLNVSVASAVCLFEVVRQRQYK